MAEQKKLTVPKQDAYNVEEVLELIDSGEFNRGDFVIDSDGKGTFKFSRLQKRLLSENVTKDDMKKMVEEGLFTRGAYALTCEGDTFNFFRYQKQWVQKLS